MKLIIILTQLVLLVAGSTMITIDYYNNFPNQTIVSWAGAFLFLVAGFLLWILTQLNKVKKK